MPCNVAVLIDVADFTTDFKIDSATDLPRGFGIDTILPFASDQPGSEPDREEVLSDAFLAPWVGSAAWPPGLCTGDDGLGSRDHCFVLRLDFLVSPKFHHIGRSEAFYIPNLLLKGVLIRSWLRWRCLGGRSGFGLWVWR